MIRRCHVRVTIVLAAVFVGSAPLTLINPERIYTDLLEPSLIAWLSQLIVFAVYPGFAARHRGGLRSSDVALTVGACLFAVYGLYATVHHTGT